MDRSRVEAVFHEALQRLPGNRDAFVRTECRGDDAMYRELRSLLDHHDDAVDGDSWAADAAARLVTAQATLEPGASLGPYRIERFLAAGGMGQVYRARDTRLDRVVAIKVLSPELASDAHFRERFRREARAISQLDHPHICTLYDVGDENGRSFLVMQYLEGETLDTRLTRGGLPFDQAIEYGIQMADALAAAHRGGIVHRDLKPGNILLTGAGPMLLDFGLAKSSGPISAATAATDPRTLTAGVTAQGTILGTFQYMAPEQLEGREADARSDIFALGGVLYEMVAGRRAFSADSPARLIASILKEEPQPLSAMQPLASPLVEHVIDRCLAKSPNDRWQAASDVMRELKWAARASAGSSEASRPASVGRWRAVAIGALLLIAAAAAIGRFARPSAPPDPLTFTIAPPEGGTFVALPGPVSLPWLTLSPDGRVLAFVGGTGDGRQQLWTRPLTAATAHPLAGTDGAQSPFWSPDSRSLAFFAHGKLAVIDAVGGKAQIVADAPGLFGSGTWNRDNTIVFAPTPRNDGLLKVQVGAPGPAQPVTRADHAKGPLGHFSPQFLPDGRHFLFHVGGSPGGGDAQTWVGSLDGAEPRPLLRAESMSVYADPGFVLFKRGALLAQRFDARTQQLVGEPVRVADDPVASSPVIPYLGLTASNTGTLVYASQRSEETHLVWKDRTGRSSGIVDIASASAPSLSRDGSMLAVSRTLPQTGTNIWLSDLKRGTTTRLTFTGNATAPVWSPDGTHLAFALSGNRSLNLLFMKATTGSESEVQLSTIQGARPSAWSPDGRFLLFSSTLGPKGDQRYGSDVWVLPMADRTPAPVVQTVFREEAGAFSPDGRWIAYASDESGALEVYVQAFPGAKTKRLVSSGGGAEPRWRADGRELFYLSPDQHLMSVRTTLGASFEAEKPEALFELNVPAVSLPVQGRYDVTPDGQRFLVQELTRRPVPSGLTVILNWTTLLPSSGDR